jgi:hypothetical protein
MMVQIENFAMAEGDDFFKSLKKKGIAALKKEATK